MPKAMIDNDKILSELREVLLPREPLEDITKKFRTELKQRLQMSEKSMLVGGLVPCRTPRKKIIHQSREFLAIDVGGTMLKFALISMPGCEIIFQDEFEITSRVVSYKFFDTMISWISLRLNEHLAGEANISKLLVSTTFSFPLNDRDEIIMMGKGFEMAPEVLGKSVKELIASSFDRVLANLPRRRFEVQVCGVINDSVAVYLTSKFMCKDQGVSLILGTGVNACFELPLEVMPQNKRPSKHSSNCNCLINVEAGFLGSNVVNITQFDCADDGERNMPLEDVTAGKWLPMALANVLKKYHLREIDPNIINGELFMAFADNRYPGELADGNLSLIGDISRILIQRGAFYVVAMLLAVRGLMDKEGSGVIDVGYVGSFLANSAYYQSQLSKFARGRMNFNFLDNSNLLGAAVSTYLSELS